MNEIQKLINELNKASELYYNGKESPLSDKEFDLKLEQLKDLEQKNKIIYSNSPTINVGAPVLNELEKVDIKSKPMLSLDKVHSTDEIIKFSDGNDLIASVKCDGLSVRLIYKDTDLISANTRGTGYEGSNITEHIKHFLNVPIKIAKSGTYIIDGEAIIYDKDFAIINKNGEFKNNRNTASGALSLLDTSIVEERKLSFIAWDIIEGGSYSLYHYNLEEAKDLGFTIVPAFALDCTKVEKEEINDINLNLLHIAKEKGIPCDGVVWKINDIEVGKKMGQTAHHFLNARAWKPKNEEYETELLDIEWTMGRTGVLTPVAVYNDVEIEGSICNRASLHNISVMNEVLGIAYSGQPIKVFKANMIIPQISWAKPLDIVNNNDNDKGFKIIDKPCHCPICGGETTIKDNDGVKTLWCTNPTCDGKLSQKIDHFCSKKGLDIKGLSLATIEKLIDWGWLNNVKDLYSLDAHKKEWISKPGFGEKSVQKIIDAIENSKTCQWSAFVSALGIPLIGTTASKELAKLFDSYQEFRNYVDTDDCWFDEFDGFGPEMDKSLKEFDYTEADEIAAMLNFEQQEVQSEVVTSAAGITFCITGKVNVWKNRDALKAYIESIGGKVVGSMSSKVNYLINNDNTSTSAKNVAAKKAGIPIITEAEFIDAFGQN